MQCTCRLKLLQRQRQETNATKRARSQLGEGGTWFRMSVTERINFWVLISRKNRQILPHKGGSLRSEISTNWTLFCVKVLSSNLFKHCEQSRGQFKGINIRILYGFFCRSAVKNHRALAGVEIDCSFAIYHKVCYSKWYLFLLLIPLFQFIVC